MLQPNDIAIICEVGHKWYGGSVIIKKIATDDIPDTKYQAVICGVTKYTSNIYYWWQLMTPEEFYGKESTQTYLEQSSH